MRTRRLLGGLLVLATATSLLFAATHDDSSSIAAKLGEDSADGSSDSDGDFEPPPPPADSDLAILLMRANLDAEALCAAGVPSASVATLLATPQASHDAAPQVPVALDAAAAEARGRVDRLRRLVRSGQGSQEDVARLAHAKADFAFATAARDAHFDSMRAAVAAQVSTEVAGKLQRIHANRSWKLPTQYLLVDREERDWVALRDALAVKRIHEQYGEDFPQAVQQELAGLDGHVDVAAARVRLETDIAAVQTAWNAAVSE